MKAGIDEGRNAIRTVVLTTALIKANYPDGKVGYGTGFFYGVNVDAHQVLMLLVTNKHVIEGAAIVEITLVAGNQQMSQPLLGTARTIMVPTAIFFGHSDPDIDVSVAPIGPWINSLQSQGKWVFLRSLSPSIALTDGSAATLDALEEVTFIGYPNGLYDQHNLLPIADVESPLRP